MQKSSAKYNSNSFKQYSSEFWNPFHSVFTYFQTEEDYKYVRLIIHDGE